MHEVTENIDNDRVKHSIASTVGVQQRNPNEEVFAKAGVHQLKRTSVRGGIVTLSTQAFKFALQAGSVAILARLLTPQDFGLQGMVLAMTGFLGLFKDVGLSAATVQREIITHEQLSTLFWINVAVGAVVTTLTAVLAPAVVAFYHEPRLFWVTVVSASAFLFSAVGAQHSALLLRTMRFGTVAKISVVSLTLSTGLGIGMAALGCGYWALVATAVSFPLISTIGSWLAVPWLPGMPRRGCGIRAMLFFGGTVTCNNLVVYLGYNAEKVLLGRSWGAAPLGLYGRAYQLLDVPLQQLHGSMYTVAFPALSRIQNDSERLCRSFLKGYSLLLTMSLPMTMASALFADEIIRIVLGPKWMESAPILRLLTPTMLVFGMINPFGWFLIATGHTVRSLKMALVISPTVILGIWLGIRNGPVGVAIGYSIAMSVLLIPMIAWAMHGTGITVREYWRATRTPLLAGLVAAACGLGFKIAFAGLAVVPMLVLGLGFVCLIYVGGLLMVREQRELYVEMVNQVVRSARPKEEDITPV